MKPFCIPIKIDDENDLYDKFLPSGMSFSGELVDYLTDYIEDRKPGEKLCIELHAATEPDMERFRKTYAAFLEKLIRRNRVTIGKVNVEVILFLIMGIAFVSLGFILVDKVDRIVAEIIAAAGSFALWGAIAAFLETLPTLRYKDKLLKVFLKAEICYRHEE